MLCMVFVWNYKGLSNRNRFDLRLGPRSPGKFLSVPVVFMKQGRRFGLSATQKCDVWRRVSGASFREIAKSLD
jgi:hypothetical protein